MNKIDLNNLDKSTWEPFKFEEIASKVSETVDPNKTDLPIYIGLEHIDADDIHIRRQGTPDDVNGQKLKCYPGDVIFGKRRAYQRKAAIVDFEGICSAHAFVLRANPEVIDPKLFPFFLHSDQFMHRMVDISVGGLSPTINWGDLKHQEFLLPPKDQQAQLAELLWAMDEVIESEKKVLNKIEILLSTSRSSHFTAKDGVKKVINDIAKVRAGIGFPLKYQGEKYEKFKFFKVGDMNTASNERYMNISDHTISHETLTKLKGKFHNKGTVVFPKVGAAIATEKKRILLEDSIVDNNTMGVSLYNEIITPEYLHDYFITVSLDSISNNGTVPSLNAKIIESLIFYQPAVDKMNFYMKKIESIYKAEKNLISKIQSTKTLQKSIINQIF